MYIADGKIVDITNKPADFTADHTIDCSQKIICPGLIDLNARFGALQDESTITLESELHAAAANGITTLLAQPDSGPLLDDGVRVESVLRRAQNIAKSKVLLLGALTENLAGEQLAPMASLKKAGCVGLTQTHHPIKRYWPIATLF